MNNKLLFLVGAGNLEEEPFRLGTLSLSTVWGGALREYSNLESPIKVLNSLPKGKGLIQIRGDVATVNSEWGSWLEALGSWKQPTVLFVKPLITGEIPGMAYAYASLCKELAVPLVGVVQLGGNWNLTKRTIDGLPWCGCLADATLRNKQNIDSLIGTYEVAKILSNRIAYL